MRYGLNMTAAKMFEQNMATMKVKAGEDVITFSISKPP